MLIYQDKDIKVYTTNNVLLILKGEKVVKEMYVEDDRCLVDDIVSELKEKQFRSTTKLLAVK